MIDDVQNPPAHGPSLANCVGDPIGPKAPRNRHGRQIRIPGVARIFGYDFALLAGLVVRRVRRRDGMLLQDPPTVVLPIWIPALASLSAIFTFPSVGQNNLICWTA